MDEAGRFQAADQGHHILLRLRQGYLIFGKEDVHELGYAALPINALPDERGGLVQGVYGREISGIGTDGHDDGLVTDLSGNAATILPKDTYTHS